VYGKYLAWQRASFLRAKVLQDANPFDLVHHFSWGSLPWGSPLWRLRRPFIFGPIGGGQQLPKIMAKEFPAADRRRQRLRSAAIRSSILNPLARQAVVHARVSLATNSDTLRLLEHVGAHDARLMLPDLTPAQYLDAPPVRRRDRETSTILWVGRLLPLKGLNVALRTLSYLPEDAILRVIGDGPDIQRARAFADSLGLAARVEFVGAVPWEAVLSQYDRASVFLFTSLRDSSGPQVLEAAARGLPIVALNHHGIRDWVPPDAGNLVSVGSADASARRLADAIDALLQDDTTWNLASRQSRLFAEQHSASAHASCLDQLYVEVVSDARR
jgi:glycosyltransferase involved in cell wall biosynthesis